MAAELTNASVLIPEVLPPDQQGWHVFATEGHRNETVVRLVSKPLRVVGMGLIVVGTLAFYQMLTAEQHTAFREAALRSVVESREALRDRAVKAASVMAPVPAEVIKAKDSLPSNNDVYNQATEIAASLRTTGNLPHDLPVETLSRKDWLAGNWTLGKAAVWQPNDRTIFIGAFTENNEDQPGRWVQAYRKGAAGRWYLRGIELPNTWTVEGGEMSPNPEGRSTLKATDIAMTITGEE